MSNQINANVLKNFMVRTLGIEKLNVNQAQKYGVDAYKFAETDTDENNYIDVDEILENSELYEQFATMYIEERDNKANEKNEEREKEEETKVKDKNEAGV